MEWKFIPNTKKRYIIYKDGIILCLYRFYGTIRKEQIRLVEEDRYKRVVVFKNSKKMHYSIDQLLWICFQKPYRYRHSDNELERRIRRRENNQKSSKKLVEKGYYKTEKNRNYMREYRSIYSPNQIRNLSDIYITEVINQNCPIRIKRTEIPLEILETKRKQLCLHRKLKHLTSQE